MMDLGPPPQMSGWLNSLPQNYVGTLYAKIKPPYSPFGIWYKVPVWGQVADGRPHKDAVENMLYNSFPFHGKGWTYVAWRNEPSSPELNNAAREGAIENPAPYDGKAYFDR
jgi:hypothetical protein